jgi:hypothetical protein
MSDQLPTTTKPYPGLPPVAIDDRALAKFTIDMVGRLQELEERFVEPRQHPRLTFAHARGASRRPR